MGDFEIFITNRAHDFGANFSIETAEVFRSNRWTCRVDGPTLQRKRSAHHQPEIELHVDIESKVTLVTVSPYPWAQTGGDIESLNLPIERLNASEKDRLGVVNTMR